MKPSVLKNRLVKSLYEASIRSKIIFILMFTVVIALVFTEIALFLGDIARDKRRLSRNVTAIAQVIVKNSTASIAFRDLKSLNETLQSLSSRPEIVAACVYNSTLELLAHYVPTEGVIPCPPKETAGPPSEFVNDRIWIREPILLEGKKIGALHVSSDLSEIRKDVQFHLITTALVFFSATLISLLISRRVERIVSGPILALASTARNVSKSRNYSIRAEESGGAEMEILINAFNSLLSEVEHHVQERDRLLSEADRAVRVRDEFMSVASHELRTPITPLKAQVQLIQKIAEKNQLATYPRDRLKKLLSTADRQLTRLSRLVDDLLDVTRISSGRLTLTLEPVDLGSLVQETVDRLRPEITSSGCTLTLDLNDTKSGIWDRLRVDQLIENLLTNALKYGAGRPVTITTRTEGDIAILSIQDQGIGIDKADQERIFHRFERAASSRHFGGIGLGLYITHQIVVEHRGKIEVQSAPGKGSTFTVRLPLRARLEESNSRGGVSRVA